ncbi:hypothetical protein K474DRAFT_1658865 [Panus rudis PR-1116 ss-1]|nr:hypothetical protein K474DRAFT_1658865 [Panus rudis PR-1116 ss-1]
MGASKVYVRSKFVKQLQIRIRADIDGSRGVRERSSVPFTSQSHLRLELDQQHWQPRSNAARGAHPWARNKHGVR